jgi:hypothetical protein
MNSTFWSKAYEWFKDLVIDCVLVFGTLGIYFAGLHEHLPGPLQLITFKLVLVSMAFVHAHILGRWVFGRVSWRNTWSDEAGKFTPQNVLRIVLYVTFIFSYSIGG